MTDPYTACAVSQMQSIHHGIVRLAGAELGVESFGMQVLDLPAGFADYPAHDHRADGQEEVYVVLEGSADVDLDGRQVRLDAGSMLRVAPEVTRAIRPGAGGVRILALGCVPGGAYERPEDFRIAAESRA